MKLYLDMNDGYLHFKLNGDKQFNTIVSYMRMNYVPFDRKTKSYVVEPSLKALNVYDELKDYVNIEVSEDDLEKAVENYCDDSDDYESGKEDGFEEGYNVGLNASEKLGQEFRRANWKILSKLEKYAYLNEKIDFSKDDAKEILDLINSI